MSMLDKKEKLQMRKIRISDKNLILFSVFFSFYIFLGLCISYAVNFDADIFFGADNARAFLDLTEIEYSHYRIKVHPLFLIFTQPVTLLLNGIVNNKGLSVIIMESFAGACSVVFLYNILKKLEVQDKLQVVLSCLYGFAFSTMIFSSVPETFIFAGLGLISYWYFVLLVSAEEYPFNKNIKIMFVFFGIISFGMTLTNYISYFVGVVYIFLVKIKDKKDSIKKFFKLNIINGIAIVALAVIQKMIWWQCPIFLESVIGGFIGLGYEETRYMNWSINLDKTVAWFKGIFAYSVLSPDAYMGKDGGGLDSILFGGYNTVMKCFLIVFLIITAISCVLCLKWILEQRDNCKKGYGLAMFVVIVCNLVLHYIYSSGESFMYTPHYLFMFFIIMGIGIDSIRRLKLKEFFYKFLCILVLVEIINNFYQEIFTANIALSIVNMTIPWTSAVTGTVMCGIICYAFCLFLERKLHAGVIQHEVDCMARNIMIYFGIILLCGIFISFVNNGVYGFFWYYMSGFYKLYF